MRLIRQLLTESIFLAVLGAAAGMVVAWWALELFLRISPPGLAQMDQVRVDTTVLLFVTAVAVSTGLGFGIAPAVRAARSSLVEATNESHARRHRGRSLLVVSEIAFSLVLLAGAGLMIRSVLKIQTLDLGFQAEDVVTAQLFLVASRYPTDPTQSRPVPPGAPAPVLSKPAAFFVELMEKLAAVPGVESAGAVTSLPLNPVGIDFDFPVVVQGRPRPRAGEEPQADLRVATTNYFRTMQIPLLRGRGFTELDGPASPSVLVINDTMAQQIFPGQDAVGQRLLMYGRPREIVGVVGSVRHRGFSSGTRPEIIMPYRQYQLGGMTVVVRSRLEPSVVAAAITREVHAIDPELAVSRVRLMQQFLSDSVAQPRFTTFLLAAFAALAVSLALVGVYGVMSYTVSQSTREIGVRMALGAGRSEVVWRVVRQGMTLAVAGILAGLGGAAALTQLMAQLLFGVTASDPATFVAAAVALGGASLVATCIPALRAASVAPTRALRAE
jgi:predicted permease